MEIIAKSGDIGYVAGLAREFRSTDNSAEVRHSGYLSRARRVQSAGNSPEFWRHRLLYNP